MTIAQRWRILLIYIELARNYPLAKVDAIGAPWRNPILEHLLPGLLLVKATAILDASISEYVEEKNLSIPRKPYGTTLKGKINFLVDQKVFADGDDLHRIRELRNVIAHEASGDTSWPQLDSDIAILHAALQTLGHVEEKPELAFFAERIPIDKPNHPRALFGFKHVFGVREGERLAATVEHQEYVLKDEA